MLGGIARKGRDEMPGFGEGEQPGRRSRAMFADEAEDRRPFELELRDVLAGLGN